MNTKKFDDFDDDKYNQRKKAKMKTLRNDDKYGSMFEKHNKLRNVDSSMFDDEESEDDYDGADD